MKILKTFVLLFCSLSALGQSIIKSVQINDNVQRVSISDFGNKVAIVGSNPFALPGSNNYEFPLFFIDEDLNPGTAYKVSYLDYNFSNSTVRLKFIDSLLITVFNLGHKDKPSLKGISLFNLNTEKANSYAKFGQGNEAIVSMNEEHILILMSWNNELNLNCITRQGIQRWNKDLTFPIVSTQFYLDSEIVLANGMFIFSVSFKNEQDGFDSIIFKISDSGEIISAKKINGSQVYNIHEKTNGNLIFVGKTSNMATFTMNTADAFIIEASLDFEIKVRKLVYGQYFNCSRITSNYIPSKNDLIISNSTSFEFPTIFASLDSGYNVENQMGFDFIQPELVFTNNNTPLVFSSDENTGKRLINIIDLESQEYSSCKSVESCLQIGDFNIDFTNLNHQIREASEMDTLTMVYKRFDLSLSDIDCKNSLFPESKFLAEDTFCINICDTIYSANPTTKHKRQWHIEGEGIDSLINDSISINLCFHEAGEFKLNQTIWYLGCPIIYEKKIVVLENLEITLSEEDVVCKEPPIELTALTDRPLESIIWNSIVESETFEVNASGTYSLIADDGYCSTKKDFEITFINDLAIEDEIIRLPEDTSICKQHFPYLLFAKSEVEAELFIDGNLIFDNELSLNNPGSYYIIADYLGCKLEKEFNIFADECLSQIYIPNVFSPNGDGINDQIKPLGKHFDPINFSIYNRWGALIHSGTYEWDGSYTNTILQPDIFYYSFSYLNTLSKEVEILKGEFLLIK